MIGVRTFDIRICGYKTSVTSKMIYYAAHTMICLPLSDVLKQLKDFLESHPTEIVTLSIRNDNFTFNLDSNT